MLGNLCTMMMLIASYQYGTIIYTEQYGPGHKAQDFVSNKLAVMFLISIVVAFPISSLYGVLCDRMLIWKLLLVNNSIVLIATAVFVS